MNALSHREQHRQVRRDVEATYGRRLTPDEYRIVRRDVAAQRRAEQRAAQVALNARFAPRLRRGRRVLRGVL